MRSLTTELTELTPKLLNLPTQSVIFLKKCREVAGDRVAMGLGGGRRPLTWIKTHGQEISPGKNITIGMPEGTAVVQGQPINPCE